jgi:hypothetical protein
MGPGLSRNRRARQDSTAAGVVYVATNDPLFVEHATVSARSVRRVAPGLGLRLLTNLPVAHGGDFDRVVHVESSGDGHRDKTRYLRDLPFERTLFLDADTYVGGGLEHVFALLGRFDVAAAQAPNRSPVDVGLPVTFPELNTGVLALRRNRRTRRLLERWHELHLREAGEPFARDQPSFRRAVWESEASLAVLPPEFNCRFEMAGVYNLPIAVLHGFASEEGYARVLETMNSRVDGPVSHHTYNGGLLFGPSDDPRVLADLGAAAGGQPTSSSSR